MLFCEGHDLERSRSWVKITGTIRFLDVKNMDLDTKIIFQSALVEKLWPKTYFCKMVDNEMRSRICHVQTAQNIFLICIKAFTQVALC